MADSPEPDPVMVRVQALLEKSQLTMDELGRRMGYEPTIARKAAWQFVRRTNDPRMSMLRKFAAAVRSSRGNALRLCSRNRLTTVSR